MAPLIVITGPTASGKSDLALRLAERWGGEIICADSRTVYRGLDIGTAKPSREDQARVPHHLLDIVNPDERFTAHDFQEQALRAIASIRSRDKIPFLVGGTGLYIDSVVLEFKFGSDINLKDRKRLETLSINELQTMLKKQHIELPSNALNKRHLVRELERRGDTGSRRVRPRATTHVVAIATEKSILQSRILERIRAMVDGGVIEEAKRVAAQYGWSSEALSGNIYQHVRRYTQHPLSRDEMINECAGRDWQLVRRQLTWLRRHDYVRWMDVSMAEQYFDHIIQDYRDEHR